jgi:BirA family biotin operon repressor/biotin-[acetyl-CoA-carboxylase] ligase
MSTRADSDLDRAALSRPTLARHLLTAGSLWTRLRVVGRTGSTNADVVRAARAGAAEGLIVVAEQQTAGRGRQGRSWTAPPQAALTLSVLLRPGPCVPVAALGWLPLLAGVALVGAVGVDDRLAASLKWPNDLLVGPASGTHTGKCAGVLAEVVGSGAPGVDWPAVVVGIGLNVSQRASELPAGPDSLPATSLALAGAARVDRARLLVALLDGLAGWYRRWRGADGDPERCGLAAAYRRHCATLGQEVSALLPDATRLYGRAEDIDEAGRLVLATASGTRVLSAGDVHHVRSWAHHDGIG